MDMTDTDCEDMFRTNVLASFRVTLAVARSMMARRRGHIIIMTSIAAREVYRLGVIYCATKHALSAFARGVRLELQGHGIRSPKSLPGWSIPASVPAAITPARWRP
jgi:NADP-dependent 3-hydroxy acid dehydrogenase YdfG